MLLCMCFISFHGHNRVQSRAKKTKDVIFELAWFILESIENQKFTRHVMQTGRKTHHVNMNVLPIGLPPPLLPLVKGEDTLIKYACKIAFF